MRPEIEVLDVDVGRVLRVHPVVDRAGIHAAAGVRDGHLRLLGFVRRLHGRGVGIGHPHAHRHGAPVRPPGVRDGGHLAAGDLDFERLDSAAGEEVGAVFRRHLRVLRHEPPPPRRVHGLILLLEREHDGAAFERDLTGEVADLVVGLHASDFHRQVERDLVAGLPGPVDHGEALVHLIIGLLPVHQQRPLRGRVVAVGVQVGRHGMPLDPAGDAQGECEFAVLHIGQRDLDPAVPRVIRGLREHRVARIDRARSIEQHVDRAVLLRADVLPQRGDRAHDVRRAARAAEPCRPRRAGRLQQVRVEEPVAGERDARERAVVHGPLERVHILRVAVHQEHPVGPEEERHGSARLVVAPVRQLVIVAVGLAAAARAAAAREVVFLPDDVLPDLRDRVHVPLVAGERGHVGHACVHVIRADGVPDGLVLLEHRLVRLAVGVARTAFRLVLQEMRRELQPAFVSGLAVQLRQAHFDDLVPGGDARIVAAEVAVHELGRLYRHVKQRAVAGRLVIRRGTFVEVPQVVQLVAQVRIVQPALLVDPLVRRRIRVHRAERVQVAVGLLRRLNMLNDVLHLRLQLRVRVRLERIRRALQELVDVRVVERQRGRRPVLERRFSGGTPLHRLGSQVEVLQTPRLQALLQREGDRDLAVDFLAFREETGREPDLRERDGLDRIIRFGRKCRGGEDGRTACQYRFCHDVTCHEWDSCRL